MNFSATALEKAAPHLILVFSCLLTVEAVADHGGAYHSNVTVSAPAASGTGDYTVSWTTGGDHILQLEEKVNSGAYQQVYAGFDASMDFSHKPPGAYSYRIRFYYCYYTCIESYSLPTSINVFDGKGNALSAAESRLDEYFYEILSAIASDSTEISKFSDILSGAAQSELSSVSTSPDPYTVREITMIKKIRYLQNIGTAYQQGSIKPDRRVGSGYLFLLDGETDLGLVKIAGTIPSDLDELLHNYFVYQYSNAGT